jgi:molecular chaperone GrpE
MNNSDTVQAGSATIETNEVEKLQEQLKAEHERYLYSLADFDNFRRRTERDLANAVKRGKRGLVLAFIEVVDSFDRALQQVGNAPPALVEGLEAVHRKTLSLLQTQGISPYESLGEKFNPELHEAIASIPTTEVAPGVIMDEVQRGYREGDLVIRPSHVRVAQKP